MAIYKATYCYPFLNNIDPRVVSTEEDPTPAVYLTCRIDSSNTEVTGYKIKILDEDNNQIFPIPSSSGDREKISPIAELKKEGEINSGLNGTYLKIPFIQNKHFPVSQSFNSIYYNVYAKVDYLLNIEEEEWESDEEENSLKYKGDIANLKIDGESVSVGDIILIVGSSDLSKNGIWSIQKDGTLKPAKDIQGKDLGYSIWSDEVNGRVVITKGQQSHNVYYYDHQKEQLVIEKESCWESQGEKINFSADGKTYKWIITLYQGDGEISDSSGYFSIDYKNISENNCDIVLSSGSVLGSTHKRIQIAGFYNEDVLLPGEGLNDPLVLQGRYLQLMDNKNNLIGKRFYVKSYDSTYGHVYPIDDKELSYSTIKDNNVTHCQFFKYANDADSIEPTNLVYCATTKNVELKGPEKVDGIEVTEGMRILVKDQNNPSENGIYLAHVTHEQKTTIDDNGDTTIVDTEEYIKWSRSGDYDKWSGLLGACVLVAYGEVNAGYNFISKAAAGGQIDATPVFFTKEEPLQLFGTKDIRKVKFATKEDIPLLNDEDFYFEGVKVSSSDSFLIKQKTGGVKIATFVCLGNKKSFIITPPGSDKYFYVESGQKYKDEIVEINYSKTDFNVCSLYSTATILKNTTTKTYIKPFVGMSEENILHFTNTLNFSDNTSSRWLKINTLNSKIWQIEHKELKEPMESYSDLDISIPYKYDLCSYSRESDENPFTTYENPYLEILVTAGGIEHTSFELYQKFASWDDSSLINFLEANGLTFTVSVPSISAITKNSVTLKALYHQGQNCSWENYRWILLNYNGEIVQDTGKIYDKKIEVTFRGLSTEEENYHNFYTVVLLVEDVLGNVLQSFIRIIVDPSIVKDLPHPFYASLDCKTQSILLNYTAVTTCQPSMDKGIYSYKYTQEFEDSPFPWDKSISFNNGNLQILGANYSTAPEIRQIKILNNPTSLFKSNSKGSSYGVNYEHYFIDDENIINKNTNKLKIKNNNQLDCQAEVMLKDNFCGNFLTITSEEENNEDNISISFFLPDNFTDENKRTKDNLNPNRNRIGFKIQKESINQIDERTIVLDYLKGKGGDDLLWFDEDLVETVDYRQADQAVEGSEQKYLEFLHFSEADENHAPLFLGDKDDQFYLVYKNFLQTCLSQDENNKEDLTYWVDSLLIEHASNTSNLLKINDIYPLVVNKDSSSRPYWPSEDEEKNFYWVENEDFACERILNSVITTAKEKMQEMNMYQVVSHDRHEGMLDKRRIQLHIIISDIKRLLKYKSSEELKITGEGTSAEQASSPIINFYNCKTIISDNIGELVEIQITEVENDG